MTPAYLPDADLASILGLSVKTFRNKRPRLEADVFPRKDRLIGHTLAADVQTWLDRRRSLGRGEGAHHSTTQTQGST
jgi:hypothetical protein